jgi:beta-lactamase superfamily II metal-dependent hydrolase
VADADDAVHVVVLGKGVGESILIRLHDDDWVIVDSFRSPHDGRPVALEYFNQHGVDPARDVSAVVLTHLHSDHSEGIDELFRECSRATFSMPAAVPDAHWDGLLARLMEDEPPRSDKLQEIANAFRLAFDTGRFRPMGIDSYVNTKDPELSALAPLAAGQLAAHEATAPGAPAAARAVLKENYTSIVLWLQAGAATALFGADMDCHGTLGWKALLHEHENTPRLATPAKLVKVPHHGSSHAHEEAMYARLTNGSVAVLTPNRNSKLPRETTVDSLRGVCVGVWHAGPQNNPVLRDLGVQSTAETIAIEIVGLRSTGKWMVTDPGAHRL